MKERKPWELAPLPTEPTYKVTDICQILHIKGATIHNWLLTGKLKGYRVGGAFWRIPKKNFRRFMRESAQTVAVIGKGKRGGKKKYIRTNFEGV